MKRFPHPSAAVAALLLLFLMPSAGSAAKLQADLIDSKYGETRYLVSWEAGMLTSGTIYGSLNRANKKVVKKSEEFCAAQGFNRWRFATLAEIADDETLKAAWDIATGGTGKSHSTERTGNFFTGVETHNRVRRILLLSKTSGGGACKETTAKPVNHPAAADRVARNGSDGATATAMTPEALESHRDAAEQGDADAQNELGEMYGNGNRVPKDLREAVKWYRLAAQQGHGPAQLNLGLAYAHGFGVPSDHVQAHLWLNLASTSGDELARKERDDLAEKMTPEQIAEAQRLARDWWDEQPS